MEGEVVEKKVAKKRAKAPKNELAKVTVTKQGDHFVCALTGLLCGDKAIVTASYPVGAFYNIPALLRHAINSLPQDQYHPLVAKLAKEYHQPREVMIPCGNPSQVPVPPQHIPLLFEKLQMWDAHTTLHGLSTAEFDAVVDGAKTATAKKSKPEKPVVHAVDAGAYVIKTVRGEVRLEKLDGNKETANAIKHLVSKPVDQCQVVSLLAADYHIWTCAPKADVDPESLSDEVKGTVNLFATQLYGNLAYGSAVIISFKKQSFKQQ